MPFTVGQYLTVNDLKSQEDAHTLGYGVVNGLKVVPTDPASMDVQVETGKAYVADTLVEKGAVTDLTVSAADPTNPRKDIVVCNSAGTLSIVAGTAEAALPSGNVGVYTLNPEPPSIPANSIILAEIWVPAGATEITGSEIYDKRVSIADFLTHKGDASAHHTKYTDTEAQTTVKANVEVGDLKTPTKALAMNSQKITGLGAPAAQNDAIGADANIRAPDSSKLEGASKTTVQDHTPKAHTLASHSTKAHSELTGVTASQHHTKTTNASELTSGVIPSIDRLPALATGKIWKGNANRPAEVDAPVPKSIATGSYTGNGDASRQITTGFKCSAVIVMGNGAYNLTVIVPSMCSCQRKDGAAGGYDSDYGSLHASNGFVTGISGAEGFINEDAMVFYYWAISE